MYRRASPDWLGRKPYASQARSWPSLIMVTLATEPNKKVCFNFQTRMLHARCPRPFLFRSSRSLLAFALTLTSLGSIRSNRHLLATVTISPWHRVTFLLNLRIQISWHRRSPSQGYTTRSTIINFLALIVTLVNLSRSNFRLVRVGKLPSHSHNTSNRVMVRRTRSRVRRYIIDDR